MAYVIYVIVPFNSITAYLYNTSILKDKLGSFTACLIGPLFKGHKNQPALEAFIPKTGGKTGGDNKKQL